uniref:Uncharacterized protein n=1 Tax=Avena sativa TaxID=4498 RepID=A0ACD5TRE5_AVESA
MAEFALALTKTAVEGTLIRVKSAIDEEAKLKVQVQNDLVFITGEFQMMQSFLGAANRERASNDVVRTWVTQLRDLAFDVEDCIEFVVHIDKPCAWDWVRRLASSYMCMGMAPPLPLDVAAAEIQRLKARVEDVSQRNTRYNLISDSGSASKPEASAVSSVSLAPAGTTAVTSAAAFHILSEVWEAGGNKKYDLGVLSELISGKGSDLEVISLWGSTESAHLGAEYKIKEAYCDQKICENFQSRAWVKLMHPFNLDDFLESLLSQLYASCSRQVGDDDHEVDLWITREDRRLIKVELMKQVKEQRYLVVLEGVSSVAEWDAIKMYLPDSKKGSRIVVSTEHLGIALLCTGEPYHVSELSRSSDDQCLCAFLNKRFAHRLYVGELNWQISRRGVISVWGGTTFLLDGVFDYITLKWKESDGVEFQRHSWVDAPKPFDLNVFARCLLVNFHSDDFQAIQIAAVGIHGVIERCCKFLRQDDCLLVINGLESTHDWDLIKATFLSETIKGCTIVTVDEASVATHCADNDDKVFNIKDVEHDVVFCGLIKEFQYNVFGGKQSSHRGRLLSDRKREALNWLCTFEKYEGHSNRVTCHLVDGLRNPGVISLWGIDTVDKSAVVRLQYCGLLTKCPSSEFTTFSWVDVPHPFDLTEFCWRLLLDFHSDDLQAKETASVAMMKGQNPVQECHKFLREHRCLVVVNDLRSKDHWDAIRDACLLETIEGCIIVICNQESVAIHCVNVKERAFNVKDPKADVVHSSFQKRETEGYYSQYDKKEKEKNQKKGRKEEAREWMDNFELFGRHKEWDKLNELLRVPRVVCISGMAGVGKSALVRSIFYFQMLPISIAMGGFSSRKYSKLNHQGGFPWYSWVDVSHPFNLTEFCWCLLLDFFSDRVKCKVTRAVGMIESQDPVQGCVEFLREHCCFVVIDGLRSTHDWDLIKSTLLRDNTKARIFIITNEESFAAHVKAREESHAVNLKGLEADEALRLFAKKLKHDEQLTQQSEVSKLFMAKCGGIPQVIHATGEYVQELEEEKSMEILENFSNNFGYTLKVHARFRSLKGLFSWMQSYFDACSDLVKPCIFYLSVFPANHNIRRRRLLRRWVAEGYSRDTIGSSADQTGKALFSELATLSIILQQSDNEAMCQVNGFFLEYIISQPIEDNRVFVLERHSSPNSQRGGQHLTIMSSWDRDKIVFESIDFSRLRSLTVFGEWRSFFIPTSDTNNMSRLRVLDLEDTSGVTDGDIKQIGILLTRLKVLCLRGCIKITCLPSSVGNMKQLQTLDIKNTSIVALPPVISKLQKLQYISAGTAVTSDEVRNSNGTPQLNLATPTDDVPRQVLGGDDEGRTASSRQGTRTGMRGSSNSNRTSDLVVVSCSGWLRKKLLRRQRLYHGSRGVEIPATAIGSLTALHTLGVFDVGAVGGKVFLKELKKLTQLRKLRVSGINRENWPNLCSAISCQAHLKSLLVRLDDEQDLCCLDDILEPPSMLKSLKLYRGNVHASLAWMKQLRNLKQARLENLELTISTQQNIDSLMELPCQNMFHHLCVKPNKDGKLYYGRRENEWSGKEFKEAKVLKIDCGSYKVAIVFGEWIPKYVDVLVINCSSTEATLEISGLDRLPSLKEVWLKGSYSDTVKQQLQQKVDEHEKKPVLKLEDQPTLS